MRPFQFHLKEHWRYPQSLDSLLPWSETISAHLEWWQNTVNMMKDADLHPRDHSIHIFRHQSRLNTFLLVERFKMETPESIRASLNPGNPHPHSHKLKEVPTVFPWFSGSPVHLPPFWPSHSPTSLYNK